MPRRWTELEEREKREELTELYVRQNKTIFETGAILKLHPGSVYDRLVRLGIPTQPKGPQRGSHNARILHVPAHSGDLAEFCGIMLGDGHLGTRQLTITANIKTDAQYVAYVQDLVEALFHYRPPRSQVKDHSVVDLYLTSTPLMRELPSIGLYSANKVKDQVGIPDWILSEIEYQQRFVRGFFDTDGSIYLLKHFNAPQMLFKNRSIPLLDGTRKILLNLGYHPSRISGYSVVSDATERHRAVRLGDRIRKLKASGSGRAIRRSQCAIIKPHQPSGSGPRVAGRVL
jgi:hypothetical protein